MTTEIVDQSKRALGERLPETQVLADRLALLAVGEVVTYKALDELVGYDIRAKRPGILMTARDSVQSEHHIITDAVSGVGIKRLDDTGTIGKAKRRGKAIKNQVRKAVKELREVNPEKLDNAGRAQYFGTVGKFAALSLMSGRKAEKRIESAIASDVRRISGPEVLKIIKGD